MAGGPIRLPIVSKFDDKGIRQAEKSLTNFGKNAGIALGAATAAVGAFGAMSVKAFADFDAEMTKSLAIMGDVSDSLRGEMAQAAREVAKETTFSANQAAESFFFLASAGLDATQSIAALPQVSKFAQAGMFDMALATDLLTDAQSALGLTVDDATANLTNLTRVSDVLVKANTLANASVEQFSTALTTKAGAALRSLGKEVEEGVAVLAAFADQGIKGEVAGTQLSIVLRDLTTKAIDNRREFDRYNVSVFDSAGEMRNMADIVGDLERALDGMSDETAKATLLQMGFSDKSLASLMALMGTSEAIREYEQSLKDAGGTTDEVSGKQLETFNAQLELLKSRFTDVMLSVGEGLTPTLMTFAEEMGPLIDQLAPALIGLFEELGPVITEIAEQLPGFIESLIPLVPVVGDLALLVMTVAESLMPVLSGAIETITPIIDAFTGLLGENGEMFGALILATVLFVGALRLVSGALVIFGGSSAVAAGGASGLFATVAKHPFIAFLIAVGGAIVGLNHFYTATEQGKEFVRDFVASTIRLALELQNSFAEAFNKTNRNLEIFVNGFITAFEKVAKAITAIGGQEVRINVPRLQLSRMEITGEREIQRRMGTLFDDMKFTPKNFTGGPGSFPLGAVDRRFGGRGAQGLDFGTGQAMPQRLFGMAPFSPEGISAQRFQFEQGISGFPGLGTGQPADQRKYEITVNAGMGTDPAQLGDEIYNILLQYDRYAAPVFQSARQ